MSIVREYLESERFKKLTQEIGQKDFLILKDYAREVLVPKDLNAYIAEIEKSTANHQNYLDRMTYPNVSPALHEIYEKGGSHNTWNTEIKKNHAWIKEAKILSQPAEMLREILKDKFTELSSLANIFDNISGTIDILIEFYKPFIGLDYPTGGLGFPRQDLYYKDYKVQWNKFLTELLSDIFKFSADKLFVARITDNYEGIEELKNPEQIIQFLNALEKAAKEHPTIFPWYILQSMGELFTEQNTNLEIISKTNQLAQLYKNESAATDLIITILENKPTFSQESLKQIAGLDLVLQNHSHQINSKSMLNILSIIQNHMQSKDVTLASKASEIFKLLSTTFNISKVEFDYGNEQIESLFKNSFADHELNLKALNLIFSNEKFKKLFKDPVIGKMLEVAIKKSPLFYFTSADCVDEEESALGSANDCYVKVGGLAKLTEVLGSNDIDKINKLSAEFMSTLIHELTHYAMFQEFGNSNPYVKGDNKSFVTFDNIQGELITKLGTSEEHISTLTAYHNKVFHLDSYDSDEWHAEIIARISETIAHYLWLDDDANLRKFEHILKISKFDEFFVDHIVSNNYKLGSYYHNYINNGSLDELEEKENGFTSKAKTDSSSSSSSHSSIKMLQPSDVTASTQSYNMDKTSEIDNNNNLETTIIGQDQIHNLD